MYMTLEEICQEERLIAEHGTEAPFRLIFEELYFSDGTKCIDSFEGKEIMVRSIPEAVYCLKLTGPYGYCIVHPSVKSKAAWQATYFWKNDIPSGDSMRDTRDECIWEALDRGYIRIEEFIAN